MFPVIPVVATALVAGLGYALTRKEEPKTPASPVDQANAQAQQLLAQTQAQAAQLLAQQQAKLPPPITVSPTGRVMSSELAKLLASARARANSSSNDTNIAYRSTTLRILTETSGKLAYAGWPTEAQELAAKGVEIAARPPPFVPGVMPPPSAQTPTAPVYPPSPQPLPPPPSLEDLIKKLPAPVLPPSPVEPTSQTGTVLGTPGANLRGNPSVTAPILIGLVNGTKIKVLDLLPSPTTGAPQGWVKALAPTGQTGYVSKEFVRLDAEPLPGILPAVLPAILPAVLPSGIPSLMATVLGTPGANMRSQPSTSGAIVVGLFNGTKVKILNPVPSPPTTGAPKGWYNVQSQSGQTGYVSAEFLRLDMPVIAGESYMFTPGREGNLRRRNIIRG